MDQLIDECILDDIEDCFEVDAFEQPERTPEELYLLVKWGDSSIEIED